jgi:predicted ATP-dependent endonuclease of OLD family
MYLAKLIIENFRCFGEGDNRFVLSLKRGLTALVGENEAGKSAVIDALRFALGTTDQEWYRLEDSDFRPGEKPSQCKEIKIVCKFEGLEAGDKRAFVEYLTYGEKSEDEPVLYINWTAKDTGEKRKGQPFRRTDLRSGKNGDGPEWRLVKAAIIAGSALPITAAVRDFHECAPRLVEQGKGFGAAFDGARFSPMRSEGHQVARQGQQQILP